jgi:CHASE3 domain sensor protein
MTTTQRTRHPATCPDCQGTGMRPLNSGAHFIDGRPVLEQCMHRFRTDTTGPTDDEIRIAELENTLSRMMAETDAAMVRARDAGLEEAAQVVDAEGRDTSLRFVAPNLANKIRALKGKA